MKTAPDQLFVLLDGDDIIDTQARCFVSKASGERFRKGFPERSAARMKVAGPYVRVKNMPKLGPVVHVKVPKTKWSVKVIAPKRGDIRVVFTVGVQGFDIVERMPFTKDAKQRAEDLDRAKWFKNQFLHALAALGIGVKPV